MLSKIFFVAEIVVSFPEIPAPIVAYSISRDNLS